MPLGNPSWQCPPADILSQGVECPGPPHRQPMRRGCQGLPHALPLSPPMSDTPRDAGPPSAHTELTRPWLFSRTSISQEFVALHPRKPRDESRPYFPGVYEPGGGSKQLRCSWSPSGGAVGYRDTPRAPKVRAREGHPRGREQQGWRRAGKIGGK